MVLFWIWFNGKQLIFDKNRTSSELIHLSIQLTKCSFSSVELLPVETFAFVSLLMPFDVSGFTLAFSSFSVFESEFLIRDFSCVSDVTAAELFEVGSFLGSSVSTSTFTSSLFSSLTTAISFSRILLTIWKSGTVEYVEKGKGGGKAREKEVKETDYRMIDFKGMSNCLGLFYAYSLV